MNTAIGVVSCSVNINVNVNVNVIVTRSVLIYAAENWTLKKAKMNRLLVFEMKCIRNILNVKWQQKIKNKEIPVMKRTRTKYQYLPENYPEEV